MLYIVLLILLGVLFLVAELVLLPGVSIGAILSLVCYGVAVYLGFANYDVTVGLVVLAVVVVLSLVAIVLSLRAKTWRRLSLSQQIKSTSAAQPDSEVKIGAVGVAISRIAPMGKVEIEGHYYEAKSVDVYIDQREKVEVVGFENFSIVVRKKG